MKLSTDPSRKRTLIEARAVLDDCRSTRAELSWALRVAVQVAESAEARLREGEPIISAIESIAARVAEDALSQ